MSEHSIARQDRKRWGTRLHRFVAAGLGVLLAVAGLAVATPAVAAPQYQITGEWAPGTPSTVKSGDVVTGVWRVNVNDDAPAPGNAPVQNVTVTVAAQNGVFTSVPDACLTSGVTPASGISADGGTLTCNLGTHDEGTSVILQAPITASGPTGSQIQATGSIGGQNAALSPIDIVNQFGMDMRWGTGIANYAQGSGYFLVSYEWTLSKLRGSDPGQQSLTYDLNIASAQGSGIQVDPQGCTPYSTALVADGHPWSGGSHPASQTTAFPGTCSITQTGANTFQLTLTGIDYAPASPPTLDSAGNRLPVDQVALASGSVWIRVLTAAAGSATVTSNAPTYTSTTGQTAQDDPANNAESKSWTLPGTYSSGWGRGYTNSGGTTWDDTYRVSAGTTVGQYMDTGWQRFADRPGARLVGMCSALDTKYVTFNRFQWSSPPGGVAGSTVEYYTGSDAHLDENSASYDPNGFDCTPNTGWSTTPPVDPTQVRAVRVMMTEDQARVYANTFITPVVFQTIKPTTPAGTDVWSFFSGIEDVPLNNWWNAAGPITNTPGSRYPYTTGFRDVLRIVSATPAIAKSVDRSVVTPGAPAVYTLTYSANGAGAIPATVDGYQLVDTLPAGVTYVPGSAAPAPSVATNGSGQQVLTWTVNGVTTNADHALTYQAVADNTVTPGAALTNSVSAAYGGITKTASAQVTVATDGYTTILKTADAPFIPNVTGDGRGAGSWTVTTRSYDPLPQPFTDTIDILPYRGDGRGTSYSGSYTLTSVTPPGGAQVYYTTADPATLSDDPSAGSNGAAGDITGNTVGWSTTYTAAATAVRVIGGSLAPGATQQFGVHIGTDGARGGDQLVNRAQGIAGHTGLVMRTSAPITIANYYSATLLKEVQDVNGVWHDANTALDYPTFHYGDTVKYRITATNTGQGTLTNVNVTDDKNPSAGAFHIASLAPGASQSHEYSIVLDPSVGGTIVNTACASADLPADSQVAATIPCDPAGIDIVGYHVAKTSDPAAGTAVTPGQKITYTVTVTQRGSVPAAAVFTDTLTRVLDDADYNGDVTADVGTATVTGSTLAWSGTLPVGGVAHVTYSVTVKATQSLGDSSIDNLVTSPGCDIAADCLTHHDVGSYTYSKTSNPASGTPVRVGDAVTYSVAVAQVGRAPQAGVTVTDDLSGVLDDATWVGNQAASSGAVTRAGNTLTWTGDLAVGQTVTITYAVRVTGGGDAKLANQVVSAAGSCVPAPDQNPDCRTQHRIDPVAALAVTGGGAVGGWIFAGLTLFGAGFAALIVVTVRRRQNS
ncbi:hypothetical protein ABCS02_11980 [Microbacterium sp. X-17]|uniref:DUF7927 domain-containing protein n=1 Tax=Microbacterium sp. X-17 TaxID=3144404 RepID=UPI0031F4AFCB